MHPIEKTLLYVEEGLDGKLDLASIADALHYSRYHLSHLFTETFGMTLRGYALRRQMTEAARLLAFSEKPVMEIALCSGYESQQAFTAAFRALYKLPPAAYRARGEFYPLQLPLAYWPKEDALQIEEIVPADKRDIPAWMGLVRLSADGFPCLNEAEHLDALRRSVRQGRALILQRGDAALGAMSFSDTGQIDFLALHPQYRNTALPALYLAKLREMLEPGQPITITTYRRGDRADTGHRTALRRLGFVPGALAVEFGYPTQCFTLAPGIGKPPENERGFSWLPRLSEGETTPVSDAREAQP